MDQSKLINTSSLAKHYRTTTGDIERKLTNAGLSPIRTVTMQSGRRFMVWDRDAAFGVIDKFKADRLEMLRLREEARMELAARAPAVPRTGYMTPVAGSPDIPPTPYGNADDEEGVPADLKAVASFTSRLAEAAEAAAAQHLVNTKKIDRLLELVEDLQRRVVNLEEALGN